MAEPTPIFQARAGKLVTIGQVLALLTPEFPELTQSKLRFLEENGLITPQRTDSGYRKFAESDVERLRLILELQRDRYLPLKVIGQYLADLDAGKSVVLPGEDGKGARHARIAQVKKGHANRANCRNFNYRRASSRGAICWAYLARTIRCKHH